MIPALIILAGLILLLDAALVLAAVCLGARHTPRRPWP